MYLVQGAAEAIIISGGMSCIIPDVLRQFREFGIDQGRITKLLILHSHFDHVGIVPYFARKNPGLTVYASPRAWEILSMPRALDTINFYSRATMEIMGVREEQLPAAEDHEWRDDIRGLTVRDGDRLDVGGLTVSIIETPGHSSCCLSAYVPELKALFPSDAGGIPYGNDIIPSGNSNYTQYQESLEKLEKLEIRYACADHFGYITGEEAEAYMTASIDAAGTFRTLMERTYRRTGDIDRAVQLLVAAALKARPDYFLPQDILTGVYRQMVRHIANT
ncbi:MAG: MBL fold metallo-hydrolase [Deltaproteobacteria bacterium]|nr:MBL fold metallo-hydrolase [Deltaproteobacteria bacterium]